MRQKIIPSTFRIVKNYTKCYVTYSQYISRRAAVLIPHFDRKADIPNL
ncbi:hypothetical protein [Clostridium ragsdalei]|nr:hypothetical protein [Clostridium ragsdalei]